jgi:hypothetical protein
MSLKELVEQTCFHEAEIVGMQYKDNHVQLQFENVVTDVEADYGYCVTVDMDVTRVIKDEEEINALSLEGEGSSVLDFERSGNVATLLVDWRYYSERRSETHVYTFEFSSFDLKITGQKPIPC